MADLSLNPVESESFEPIEIADAHADKSLQTMTKETVNTLLFNLKTKFEEHHKKLSSRQIQVKELHELQKAINNETNEDGTLKCPKDGHLFAKLQRAKQDHKISIEDEKVEFSKDARERLLENIRMTVADLQVLNEMDLQTFSQLQHDWNHAYQLAQDIIKPLDRAIKNRIDGIK